MASEVRSVANLASAEQSEAPSSAKMGIAIDGARFSVLAPPNRQKYWSWVSAGQWERSTFLALGRHTHQDARYIDIGTWIGPTVLYAASRGARVIGFEPDPVALAELSANIAENPVELQKRIQIEPYALSILSGTRTLYAQEFGDSMSRFTPEWQKRDGVVRLEKTTECRVLNILEAAERFLFGAASIIKIDVEGHEYEMVPALGDLLHEHRVPVHLSLHPTAIGNSESSPERTKAYRIEMTTRVLDTFDSYNVQLCEPKAIVATTRSEMERQLAKTGCLFGPLLFTPDNRPSRAV